MYSLTKVAGDAVDSFQFDFTVPEVVMAALLTVIGGIIVALINKMGNRTAKLERQSKEIHYEVKNNGGSSMKDGVDEMKTSLEEVLHKQDIHAERIGNVAHIIDLNANNIQVLRDDSVRVHDRLDGLGKAVDRKVDRPYD